MGAEQTGRYSTTMGISIPVRRGRRPDWFLLARHFVLPKPPRQCFVEVQNAT